MRTPGNAWRSTWRAPASDSHSSSSSCPACGHEGVDSRREQAGIEWPVRHVHGRTGAVAAPARCGPECTAWAAAAGGWGHQRAAPCSTSRGREGAGGEDGQTPPSGQARPAAPPRLPTLSIATCAPGAARCPGLQRPRRATPPSWSPSWALEDLGPLLTYSMGGRPIELAGEAL